MFTCLVWIWTYIFVPCIIEDHLYYNSACTFIPTLCSSTYPPCSQAGYSSTLLLSQLIILKYKELTLFLGLTLSMKTPFVWLVIRVCLLHKVIHYLRIYSNYFYKQDLWKFHGLKNIMNFLSKKGWFAMKCVLSIMYSLTLPHLQWFEFTVFLHLNCVFMLN